MQRYRLKSQLALILTVFLSLGLAAQDNEVGQYSSQYSLNGTSETIIFHPKQSLMTIIAQINNSNKKLTTHFCEPSSYFLCFKNEELQFAVPRELRGQQSWNHDGMTYCVVFEMKSSEILQSTDIVYLEFGADINCNNTPKNINKATFDTIRGLETLSFGDYSLNSKDSLGFGNYISQHLPVHLTTANSAPLDCDEETSLWSYLSKSFKNKTRFYQFTGTKAALKADYTGQAAHLKITPSLMAIQFKHHGKPSRAFLLGLAFIDSEIIEYQFSFLRELGAISNPILTGKVTQGKCELVFNVEGGVVYIGSARDYDYLKVVSSEGDVTENRFIH